MGSDVIQEFMNGPLVTWIRTFEIDGGRSLTYAALADGVFLYDVMTHIDPRESVCHGRCVNRHPDDAHARLANLSAVLHLVKSFYEEVLGQCLLLSLPDVVVLSRAGEDPLGLPELRRLLLLVLGCAVQSPTFKGDVIGNIKKLNVEVQHEIVQCIQQVTDNPEAVLPGEWTGEDEEALPEGHLRSAFNLLVRHCRRLAHERNSCHQELLKTLCGESDSDESGDQESVQHLGVQVADLKAQLRRLRQEFEEKSEQSAELKEELEQNKEIVSKLRQENIELVQDARAARAWRDEADILSERAARVESLESEVSKYKDKMADIDFYKSRVEELREDNRILVETKEMLEDQLSSARRRAEQVLDLENTILQLKQTVNQLTIERDSSRDQLQEVLEENAQLQLSTKNSLSESATLVAQLDHLKTKNNSINGVSIGNDIVGEAKASVLKLQLENQRLEAELEKTRHDSWLASSDKVLELEKENRRLSLKVQHLQEASQKVKADILATQEEADQKSRENHRLCDTISTVKLNSERQIKELQEENSQLLELIENLRERQKKTMDTRLVDVESENRKLIDVNLQLQSQMSRLEYEKQQLSRVTERLRESADRLSEVEIQKAEIERENRDLQSAMSAFKSSCEKYEKLEQDHASLEVDFARVSKMLENMKTTLAKFESEEGKKIKMEVEIDRLNRTLDSYKSSSTQLALVEAEKEEMAQLNASLQLQVATLKSQQAHSEQMEVDLMAASNEAQKLQKSLDSVHRKLQDTDKERSDLESENSKMQRKLETLNMVTKKLNELERDLTELEGTNDRLDRENKSFSKEVSRLKNALEIKDNLIDETSTQLSSLERTNKKLNKEVEILRSSDNRVRELEQGKRELEQSVQMERKTLNTLREDLVAEKVRTQQLTNQLDTLTSNLVKLGLNPENLSPPSSEAEDDRYKALESMLEETLKRSVEVREEKIASLESRLAESVSRNQQLRKQLLDVRSDYESLLQRQQEEGDSFSEDACKEIGRLRDSLNRANDEKSCLESEAASLSMQNASYREQVCALQSQVTSLSNQNTVMSRHNASLQGENARLQVENTTLQSQSASLINQNSGLQTSATQMEADRDKIRRSYDERGARLSQLLSDHEALQQLHEQLSREYESLNTEHGSMKTLNKNLKGELKALKDRQENLSTSEEELLKLREVLEAEMNTLKQDSNSLSNLRAEHSRLKDDFRSLFSANERLRTEYKNLQGDYKLIKTDNNTLKLKITELGGDLNDTRDQMAALDVEVSKLTNKCQVLQTLNTTLEEDRRSLMSQVSLLLGQYHDLLTQTLEDKQHFHQEEKNFTDKFNNLRRQKEKLEEKIMEQYRRMENSPHKKKGFGSNLVRRVRKAGNDLINKVPRTGRSRSRGREDGGGDSPDSSSLGSSSYHANDSSLDSGSETRRSSPNLPPSPPHDNSQGEPLPQGDASESSTSPHCEENHRRQQRTLPSAMSDLFISSSLRGSLSSEEVGSLRSEGSCDVHRDEDTLSTVTVQSGSAELRRVGSRRPVYLTDNHEPISKRPLTGSEMPLRETNRNATRSSSTSSQSSVTRNHVSPLTSCSTKPPAPLPFALHSTPKGSVASSKERIVEGEAPSTPKLPPRSTDNSSAPQIPPRTRRHANTTNSDGGNISSQNSLLSSSSDSKSVSSKQAMAAESLISNENKDIVDNSIWYEYGCV